MCVPLLAGRYIIKLLVMVPSTSHPAGFCAPWLVSVQFITMPVVDSTPNDAMIDIQVDK